MEASVHRCALTKDERLHGGKDIGTLLAKGKFHAGKAIRYCVLAGNGLTHSRIMISVPKKLFRRAVRRNSLKRRIRESFRLQKHLLPEDYGFDILFIYNTKELLCSSEIYAAVGSILREIADGHGKTGKFQENI